MLKIILIIFIIITLFPPPIEKIRYNIRVIIGLCAIIYVLQNIEGFGTGIDGEALRNIASLYNSADGTLKVKNLEASGTIEATGAITGKKTIIANADIIANATINATKDLKVKNLMIGNPGTTNLTTKMFKNKSFSQGFSHDLDGLRDYIHLSNWADSSGGAATTLGMRKTGNPGMKIYHTPFQSDHKIKDSPSHKVLTIDKDNKVYADGGYLGVKIFSGGRIETTGDIEASGTVFTNTIKAKSGELRLYGSAGQYMNFWQGRPVISITDPTDHYRAIYP